MLDNIIMVVVAGWFAFLTVLEATGKVDVPEGERVLSIVAVIMSIFIMFNLFGWVGLAVLLAANVVVIVTASLFD